MVPSINMTHLFMVVVVGIVHAVILAHITAPTVRCDGPLAWGGRPRRRSKPLPRACEDLTSLCKTARTRVACHRVRYGSAEAAEQAILSGVPCRARILGTHPESGAEMGGVPFTFHPPFALDDGDDVCFPPSEREVVLACSVRTTCGCARAACESTEILTLKLLFSSKHIDPRLPGGFACLEKNPSSALRTAPLTAASPLVTARGCAFAPACVSVNVHTLGAPEATGARAGRPVCWQQLRARPSGKRPQRPAPLVRGALSDMAWPQCGKR